MDPWSVWLGPMLRVEVPMALSMKACKRVRVPLPLRVVMLATDNGEPEVVWVQLALLVMVPERLTEPAKVMVPVRVSLARAALERRRFPEAEVLLREAPF